jgi:hypothetical protein
MESRNSWKKYSAMVRSLSFKASLNLMDDILVFYVIRHFLWIP